MMEHTPGTAQPLEFLGNHSLGAPRVLEQKLHVCPCRRLVTDVENEIGFGRHLLALVNIG
jgi:hypothetical protein